METITFYSYKGGTGRTLLLANAARYFALLGKRVVALDLDFEAPGLHYKLNIGMPADRSGDTPRRGVVDYLLSAIDDERNSSSLDEYLVPVPVPPAGGGKLWLMPAGAAPSGAYWKRLTSLLRKDLIVDSDGVALAAVVDLKARIEAQYHADLLLIDSRTGITEFGGIATSVLADKVVCLFLNNRENLAGVRAVMRSLGRAARLRENEPVQLFAVLSRVQRASQRDQEELIEFLNEEGPSPRETLALDKLYVLRTDPELEAAEKLHLGGDQSSRRAPLHNDYVFLLSGLTEVEPAASALAWRRREAVQELIEWLTEDYDGNYRSIPSTFDADQIDEGVRLGGKENRYADLVAFSGDDHAEAFLAAEYVEEDLETSEVWKWWERNTRLRCVILFGESANRANSRRVFTRGRGSASFVEREERAAWAVRWPLSFRGLDDPGDRSVVAMLEAVQHGEDGFIPLLVEEWQHSVMFTLHGGAPFRPARAREILDGLARVRDPETAQRLLWRTAPDPFEPARGRFHDDGARIEEQTTRELHAPLWWRLSAQAKISHWHHRHHPRGDGPSSGVELLAEELLGLSLDQDRALRDSTASLIGTGEEGAEAAWDIASLEREHQLEFELSDDVPSELTRRVFLDRVARGERLDRSDGIWEAAEAEAREAMRSDETMARLCRSDNGRLSVVTTNLLGRYESSQAHVTVYTPIVSWCARTLRVDLRALENVVLLHETVHAVCHLGRDLDGRSWNSFSLPTSSDPSFRPDRLHEGLAQYFTFRMIERLRDTEMMAAFETLTSIEPAEYQRWRTMRDVPVERVRQILVAARTGLGDSLNVLS